MFDDLRSVYHVFRQGVDVFKTYDCDLAQRVAYTIFGYDMQFSDMAQCSVFEHRQGKSYKVVEWSVIDGD